MRFVEIRVLGGGKWGVRGVPVFESCEVGLDGGVHVSPLTEGEKLRP